MPLLTVSHHRQRQQADCLAACAAMVLDFFQLSIGYEQLLRLLGIRYFGAPFSSLRKFEHDTVLVNDPEFACAPQTVSTDPFLLAWLEQDYRYAVIKLAGVA